MWTQCLAYQCPRNYDGNGIVFVNLDRSEEHTSELQSRLHLVCRLLLEKKKKEKEVVLDESDCSRGMVDCSSIAGRLGPRVTVNSYARARVQATAERRCALVLGSLASTH